jgi:tRNA A-37 threonylcarbamoyl transferase component Bud32
MNIIIHPEYTYLNDFILNLPSFFNKSGDLIYKSRNELKVFNTERGKVVVKSFKVPHIINGFAYAFLRKSKAKRSYNYSMEIRKRGFDVPAPVAYIEIFRFGLLAGSYYISTFADGATMRDFTYTQSITKEQSEILKAFAGFTARLHEAEIYHSDYSNGNILYQKKNDTILFDLVDVNRVKFKKVTEEMGYKSFHRMDLSLDMIKVVAKEYALLRGYDVEKSIGKIKTYNQKTMKTF